MCQEFCNCQHLDSNCLDNRSLDSQCVVHQRATSVNAVFQYDRFLYLAENKRFVVRCVAFFAAVGRSGIERKSKAAEDYRTGITIPITLSLPLL